METTFIYALIDPRDNKVRYIGKANKPKYRLQAHLTDKTKTHKCSWIKSLLKEDLKPELLIIDEVSFKEWQFWEQHYISLYKSWGFNLTNGNSGGYGQVKCSETTRVKLRLANLGKKISNATKIKMSKSHKVFYAKMTIEQKKERKKIAKLAGKKTKKTRTKNNSYSRSLESIEKMLQTRVEKKLNKHSEVAKAKMRERRLENPVTFWKGKTSENCEQVRKNAEKRCKKVLQKSLENGSVKEWSSIKEAALTLNIASSRISECCNSYKGRTTIGKYKWEFKK